MGSPLSHEGPAGQPPPAAAQRFAGLPPGTSLAPLRRRLASPCKDYLCGSSNPVSRESQREERKNNQKKNETWKVAMSVPLLHIQMEISPSVPCSPTLEQLELIVSVLHQTCAELRRALCLLFKC